MMRLKNKLARMWHGAVSHRRPRQVRMPRKRVTAALMATALVTTGCTAETAAEYDMVVGLAIPEAGVTEGISWWAEQLEERSDGRISVEIYYAESLITGPESINAIRSKRVDAAWFSDAYAPHEVPMFQLNGIPYDTSDGYAHNRALYDMYNENTAFREEMHSVGVHAAFFVPYTNTVTMAAEPIETLDDLAGKRFRAAGITSAALAELHAGSVFVNVADIFESIERGIIDGVANYDYSIASLSGLADAAPYVMDMGWGMYAATTLGVSLEWYESLPPDLRRIVDDASRVVQEDLYGDIVNEAERAACELFTEQGAEFVVWDDEAVEETRDQLHDKYVEHYIDTTVARGVEQQVVEGFYDQFHDAYEKHVESSPYENNLGGCE